MPYYYLFYCPLIIKIGIIIIIIIIITRKMVSITGRASSLLVFFVCTLKELGHDAINSTDILFLPYKESITANLQDCGCSDPNCDINCTL